MKVLTIMVLIFSLAGNSQMANNTLTVNFEITKYKTGKVFVAVYNSEDSFLKNPLKGSIITVENGKASTIIEGLEAGDYAVSAFYDKNDNGKLDTNFLGIPKEPIATSNNAKGSFGPPKFKDAKFTIRNNTKIKIKF